MNEPLFSVLQTAKVDSIEGLEDYIRQLQKVSKKSEIRNSWRSAVIGELAGEVLDFFSSGTVTAIANAITIATFLVTIGNILRKMVRHLSSKSKIVELSKEAIKTICVSYFSEEDSYNLKYEPIIWGPMILDEYSSLLSDEIERHIPVLNPSYLSPTYITVISYRTSTKRARMKWQIVSGTGDRIAYWCTQTLPNRMPSFLKSRKKSSKK